MSPKDPPYPPDPHPSHSERSRLPHADEDRAYTGETRVMRRARPSEPERAPQPQRPRPQPVTRQRRSPGRILRRVALVVVAVALLLAALLYVQVRSLAEQITVADARPAPVIATPLIGANLLLVGVDQRPDHPEEGVRSDTLIVVHLDGTGRWVSMLSLPRDSMVEVGELGVTKINTAYSYGYNNAGALFGADVSPDQGGLALAAQTVERFAGIPIHYVAQINFDGFAAVIDALGGITIDVPRPIVDDAYPTPDFGVMRVEFAPGLQHMDGERALIYARTRHADSDFGRSERQQQVMRAILEELRKRGPVGQALLLPPLSRSLGGAVATTMPIDRPDVLIGLAWIAAGIEPDQIVRLQLTPETAPSVREDGSDLYWDASEVQALARRLLVSPSAESEQALVQVLNGTTATGLAGRTAVDLEQRGFTMLPAGDAPSTDVARTAVYDIHSKPATASALARLFNADVQRGAPEGVVTDADIVVVLGADQLPKP